MTKTGPGERPPDFRRAYDLALEQIVREYAPPGFLLDAEGELLHLFGDAGQLLSLQPGAFSRQILDLIRLDLRAVLSDALQQASEPGFEHLERRLRLEQQSEDGPGGPGAAAFTLSLVPVRIPDEHDGFLLLTIRRLEEHRAEHETVGGSPDELRRMAADFHSIVADTDSFIVRWDAHDGTITHSNATHARFFDSTPEQMIGKDLRTLVPDSERARFFDDLSSIAPERTRHMSVLHELPDRRIVYTEGYTRALSDGCGRISEYQSIGRDLSDQYRYQRALGELVGIGNEKDDDRATLLSRILTIGLRYFELENAFLGALTEDEYQTLAVAGTVAGTALPGEATPRERTVCDRLLDDRSVLCFTRLEELDEQARDACRHAGVQSYIGVRLTGFAGRQGAISFSSGVPRQRPFSVADESFLLLIGNWLSTLLDERRRLVVIEDQNRYYQSLYLNVPIMMFLADEAARVMESSDSLLELLGRTRREVINKTALSLFLPDDASCVEGALSTGSCRDLAVTLDMGHGRTLDCEMSCQLRDIGSLRRVRMCVLTDVSSRNRALASIEDHNRRLAQMNESLNQFAFVASHDLQEPLRKIQQFSSFLQEDYADRVDDEGRYHLRVIVTAAERMSTLIKDLLDYSRTSRDIIEPRRVSLRAIVDEVLDDLELSVREASASVHIGELPVLQADPVLLRQLFANLIGNALKYRNDEREMILSIGPGRTPDGAEAPDVIEVIDNGIGFDPDQAGHIFEPFTRLNTVQEFAGSGIGLAICATVCEKHGWTLSADSVPGQGSTFRVHVSSGRCPKGLSPRGVRRAIDD